MPQDNPPAEPLPLPHVMPDAHDAAVAKMLALAADMKASSDAMVAHAAHVDEQVASCVSAVVGLRSALEEVERKTDANTDDIARAALAPTRARQVTLPEIVDAPQPARTSATPQPQALNVSLVVPGMEPAVAASMRAIATAVGASGSEPPVAGQGTPPPVAASVHALALAAPKAINENRLWSLLIAVLVLAGEVLHALSH